MWKSCHHPQRNRSCGEFGRATHDRIAQSKSQAFVNRDDCSALKKAYVSDVINVACNCWKQSAIAACEIYSRLTNEDLQETIVCRFGDARYERACQNTEAHCRMRTKRFANEMHTVSSLPSDSAHLPGVWFHLS